MGQSIFNIAAPEDHDRLRMYLNTDSLSDPEWRKYFNIRLKRAGPRTESAVYEPVNVMGMQRPSSQSSTSTCTTICKESPTNSLNNEVTNFFLNVYFDQTKLTSIN